MAKSKKEELGFCVKCRDKKAMNECEKVTMKNGRPAMKGKCSVCGTGVYKILPSAPPEGTTRTKK